jgi:hypothetical protein
MEDAAPTEVLSSGLMNLFDMPLLSIKVNNNNTSGKDDDKKKKMMKLGKGGGGGGCVKDNIVHDVNITDFVSCSNGLVLTFLVAGEFEVRCDVKISKRVVKKNLNMENKEVGDLIEDLVVHKETKIIQIFVVGDEDVDVMYV